MNRDKNLESIFLIILLAVCATTFFYRLDVLPLLDRDEGLHAVTSKEMVLTGDWVTTRFNGVNFYDKPVLFNWLVALSFQALGFTEFAARLPAALLALGCVIVTYLMGRKMYDPAAGFIGAIILATSPELITLARTVVHDIALLFCITLALYFFYRVIAASGAPILSDLVIFYAALGAAVLAKGPIGAMLPGAIVVVFLVTTRRWDLIGKLRLPLGAMIILAVAAPWYIAISWRNSDYLDYFVRLNLNYFFSPKVTHARPFYYYLPILLGGFSPWSVFLPLAMVRLLGRKAGRIDNRPLFLAIWFAVILLFFSTASSKLGTYILPLFPPAALLVGILWRELLYDPTTSLRKGFGYSYLPLALTCALALGYAVFAPPTILVQRYGLDLSAINVLLVCSVVIAGYSLFLLFRGYDRAFFCANAGWVIVMIPLLSVWVLPSMIPFRTSQRLARKVDTLLAPGQPLVFFGSRRDTALFYTNRKGLYLKSTEQLRKILQSSPGQLVIIDDKQLRRHPDIQRTTQIVDREGDAVLITAVTVKEASHRGPLAPTKPGP